MIKSYVRIWQEVDIDEVGRHLLIAGDLTGDCSSCRHIDINYQQERFCPNCKTEFKYIASRSISTSASYGGLVKRLKEKRPDLIFIDLVDFKQVQGKSKAQDFFK